MDKYEFNIKIEQIRKLVNKSDYETAMKIADTIDWKKVRNASLLSMASQVYEKNGEYQDAKDILLLAFERAPIGKRLLYKLADLALKEENVQEAEAYYREFCDLAGDDPRQHLLRYKILKQKGAPAEQLIHSLESYTAEELDEKWLYELAELYREAGDSAKCVSTCDKIMLMFGLGKYVDKAMELKLQYAPLTKYQMDLVENREKYEAKLRAVVEGNEDDFELEEPKASDAEPELSKTSPEPEIVEDISETEVIEEPEETPVPVESEPDPIVAASYEKESVVAAVKQEEAQANLAKEMSRIAKQGGNITENNLGKTRVLSNIRRAQVVKNEETAAAPAEKTQEAPAEEYRAPEPIRVPAPKQPVKQPAEEPELPKIANHLMIEARTPEKGLELAVETLKKIQKETGIKNPVAKITGSKLNKVGILASLSKLSGKDLMIEEAGDLNTEMVQELETLMARDQTGMRVILIDNPKQMEMFHANHPGLASRFECIGGESVVTQPVQPEKKEEELPEVDNRPVRHIVPVRDGAMRVPDRKVTAPVKEEEEPDEEMDIDEFAQYACKYASEIDCSITGKSMLALYERIEIMEEDGIPLTRANAEELIEEAADKAEKPSFGKRVKGIFSSKYDKDGLLILKEEHFI